MFNKIFSLNASSVKASHLALNGQPDGWKATPGEPEDYSRGKGTRSSTMYKSNHVSHTCAFLFSYQPSIRLVQHQKLWLPFPREGAGNLPVILTWANPTLQYWVLIIEKFILWEDVMVACDEPIKSNKVQEFEAAGGGPKAGCGLLTALQLAVKFAEGFATSSNRDWWGLVELSHKVSIPTCCCYWEKKNDKG